MPRQPEIIDAPFQIIVEGADDCDFVYRFIRDRGIANYQVGCGKGADNRCLGKDGFETRILATKGGGFEPTGFVIVVDSDDDPAAAFASACAHLKRQQLPIPKAPMQVASNASGVRTAVIVFPDSNSQGGLETVLLGCCQELIDQNECVKAFCDCGISTETRLIDRHKFLLRAFISATNPKDPGIAINYWLSNKTRPFKMDHPSLDTLARFLRDFSTTT